MEWKKIRGCVLAEEYLGGQHRRRGR